MRENNFKTQFFNNSTHSLRNIGILGNPFILHDLFDCKSFVWVDTEHSFDKLFRFLRDVSPLG